ncbi:hypothetical protein HB779_03015 [Phyllobacterium sp. 628]|uniref:hypothetical protein n=1 Tax=Phyllobacterium sp. 628 TaxID=2718938 RepID=UPI0016623723|nr:hypothetical protein [Phyllobacterium sp. 628]QND50973.1 hypothetical protein HB779_03015 [Phyllobacterium sp. 628]
MTAIRLLTVLWSSEAAKSVLDNKAGLDNSVKMNAFASFFAMNGRKFGEKFRKEYVSKCYAAVCAKKAVAFLNAGVTCKHIGVMGTG